MKRKNLSAQRRRESGRSQRSHEMDEKRVLKLIILTRLKAGRKSALGNFSLFRLLPLIYVTLLSFFFVVSADIRLHWVCSTR